MPAQVTDFEDVDFVIAAWQEDGVWRVEKLPKRTGTDLSLLVESLGAHAADGGVIGFVSVGDDFFVVVRVNGQHTRFLLSDSGAAFDWDIADDVIDQLGFPEIDPADDEGKPIGDLAIVADLGMPGDEISMLSDDDDLYPDDILISIASRLGFGDAFEALIEGRRS